jgi:hypothetical protein
MSSAGSMSSESLDTVEAACCNGSARFLKALTRGESGHTEDRVAGA